MKEFIERITDCYSCDFFMMINEKLTAVRFKHSNVRLTDENEIQLDYVFSLPYEDTNLKFDETNLPALYQTEDNFKSGNAYKLKQIPVTDLYKKFYKFENGEPVEYNKLCTKLILQQMLFEGCDIQHGFYDNREECLKWNDYTVVNDKGETEVRESLAKKALLNEKQLSLLSQLKELLQSCAEANMSLFFNYQDCEICAIDKTDVDYTLQWKDEAETTTLCASDLPAVNADVLSVFNIDDEVIGLYKKE